MAKKAELLERAKELNLGVSEKNTIAEIEAALTQAPEKNDDAEVKTNIAKSGKRSAKAIKEADELEAKQERKKQVADDESAEKPKQRHNPPKPVAERRGKKFKAAAALIDKNKEYLIKEALELAIKTNPTKFDATVELHIRLGVDPKHADQNIRGMVVLPAGTGNTLRVAVFAGEDDVKKAKAAGADIAAGEEFLQQLDKGVIDFDVLISTPLMMAKLGKYARVLGPKGLMPNPKSGTVTKEIVKAVEQAKAGRVEYRVDSTGIVHLGIGKTNFTVEDLVANAQAVLTQIRSAKPASVKGNYLQTVFVTTTMGPSIKLALSEV